MFVVSVFLDFSCRSWCLVGSGKACIVKRGRGRGLHLVGIVGKMTRVWVVSLGRVISPERSRCCTYYVIHRGSAKLRAASDESQHRQDGRHGNREFGIAVE